MSKLGSLLGKEYEDHKQSILTRTLKFNEATFKVIVPSVANQYLEMDNYIEHRAAQQTDTKYRIVINFNYLV